MIEAATEAVRHAAGQTVELPLGLVIVLYSYSPERLRKFARATGLTKRLPGTNSEGNDQ